MYPNPNFRPYSTTKFSRAFGMVVGFAGVGIGLIILVAGMALLFSLPLMWLWNWLMPSIFGLREIGWLEALGIALLSGMIFKSSSASSSKS